MEKLYSCRKCVLCCLLVFFVILSTEAVNKVEINYDYKSYKLFDMRQTLVLQVNVTLDAGEKPPTVSWLKEGKPLDVKSEGSHISVSDDGKTLTVSRTTDEDAGNYTVLVVPSDKLGAEQRFNVTAVMKPLVKLAPQTSVVEGEKLTVPCTVYGVPVPTVYWTIGNKTYKESEGRVKMEWSKEKEVQKALLQLGESTMDDRNTYICGAELDLGGRIIVANETETFVRVKDKMAALWPFLGICAEVLVLCTIILIYEKKRNKTEMDESDTDGSPEQKNTPDHGKDSEVRHRK